MRKTNAQTLLLATDVFGVTEELLALVRQLPAQVALVCPHEGRASFADEQEGYAAFMRAGGVDAYARRAADGLRSGVPGRRRPFDLAVGFSAGASALWLCLAEAGLEAHLPRRAELYYGSRIRDHAHLQPRRPVRLAFAETEASFDPAPLAARLRGQGIEAEVLPGTAHGFMNLLSPGYDARVMADEVQRLRSLLLSMQGDARPTA